ARGERAVTGQRRAYRQYRVAGREVDRSLAGGLSGFEVRSLGLYAAVAAGAFAPGRAYATRGLGTDSTSRGGASLRRADAESSPRGPDAGRWCESLGDSSAGFGPAGRRGLPAARGRVDRSGQGSVVVRVVGLVGPLGRLARVEEHVDHASLNFGGRP